MDDVTADVVIVGGGMAGLVAGARASELGLAVVVLEQGTEAHYPCNTRWSGGVLHVAYRDILSHQESLLDAIRLAGDGSADTAQAGTVAANGRRFIDWLRMHGTTFVQTDVEWQQLILEPMRHIRGGLDWKDRGPDQLLGRLTRAIERSGGRLVLGARARQLIMQGDRCRGVEAERDGRQCRFYGAAVVLGDGGFQANLDLLGRHIAAQPEQVKQRGAATSFGDGLAMAEAVGARITALDAFYGHLISRDAFGNDNVWPYPEIDALACAGVLVDRGARRFTDEGRGGIIMANVLAGHDDPLGATIILDAAIWNGPGRSARIPANPALSDAGGTVWAADTIEALAGLAGLPAEPLVASVAAYNDALAAGTLEQLHPPRTTDKHRAMPIAEPPFHAVPACAGITYTMGGVLVDGASRVVSANDGVVPGLFAAGAITGGLEGGAGVAYVGGLAKAGIQGMVAAETIAQARGRPK
mgnify:CR=1 FL=1